MNKGALQRRFASEAGPVEVGLFIPYAEDSSNRVANVLAERLAHETTNINLRIFLVKADPTDRFKIEARTNTSPDLRLKRFLHGELLRDVVFPYQRQKGLKAQPQGVLLCPELLQERHKGRVIIEHVDDVNDPEFVKKIRENNSLKLAFSNRNLQIFQRPIIDAFSDKGENCLINTHPAALPDIRGIEGPFWTRYLGGDEYTTTMHVIIREIDAGPILGYKMKSVNGSASNAVMQYPRDIAPEVASMIFEHVHLRLIRGGMHPGLKMQEGVVGMYSLPTQEQIDEAKTKGIVLVDADEQIPWLADHYADQKSDRAGYHVLLRTLNRAYAAFEKSLMKPEPPPLLEQRIA